MTVSPDRMAAEPAVQQIFSELEALYAQMDRRYAQAAAHYGFECTGCEENCCLTRFYHHTFLEYLYLRKGFSSLARADRAAVRQRAQAYLDALAQAESRESTPVFRRMCPLNEAGRCILYAWRPMICRLHGIPHELALPGRANRVYGPGCEKFVQNCGHVPYYRFDRTEFYGRMAGLEARLKETLAISGKSKKMVAHMLSHDEVPADAIY